MNFTVWNDSLFIYSYVHICIYLTCYNISALVFKGFDTITADFALSGSSTRAQFSPPILKIILRVQTVILVTVLLFVSWASNVPVFLDRIKQIRNKMPIPFFTWRGTDTDGFEFVFKTEIVLQDVCLFSVCTRLLKNDPSLKTNPTT